MGIMIFGCVGTLLINTSLVRVTGGRLAPSILFGVVGLTSTFVASQTVSVTPADFTQLMSLAEKYGVDDSQLVSKGK
jgi:hypothetical protein